MVTVGTKKEVNDLLEKLMIDAFEAITDEVLNMFKKDFVKKIVYDSHGINKMYTVTNQFLNAWEWSELKKTVNKISKEMFYNPDNMDFITDRFIHGSKYSRPNDVRGNLMDILNKSGRSSSLWISVRRPAPYWDVFILSMFQGGQLSKIIDKQMSARGFKKV